MGFPFAWVCDLLDDLEKLMVRSAPLLPNILRTEVNEKTISWLQSHRYRLDANDTDADAVILTFRPEIRADRVYGLDSQSLDQIIARVSNLPRKHALELRKWQISSLNGDLSVCVERVLDNMNDSKERVVTPSAVNNVTVEEIDQALLEIAAHNDESSAEVRASKSHINFDSIDALGNLYQRLRSREAKWLTRLILKDFGAVKFPDELKCGPNIRSLPQCVLVEAKFKSSMPESERRDGPGRMRLGAAAKAYLPTPPTTAIKPLSLETTISPYTPSTTIDGNDSSSIITASSSLLSTFYNAASSNIGTPRCPSSARAGSSRRVSIATGYTGATRNRESPETLSPIRQRSPSPMSRLSRLSRRCSPRQTKYSQRSIASPGRGMVKTMGRYQKRLDSISVCGNGRCQLTKGSCPLRNCIFLLAPCISDEKWITEKLFRWHGSRYVRSPEAFTSPDSSDIFGRSSQTGKAYQRIVLVEPRKMEQTVDFLRQVEYLNSGTSGPQRRSVDVYDWRILECIAKIDRGQGSAHKSWSKYRICEI